MNKIDEKTLSAWRELGDAWLEALEELRPDLFSNQVAPCVPFASEDDGDFLPF